MYTSGPAGLVNVAQMAKRSITLESKLRESVRELQQAQRELQVASSAVLDDQHLA